MRWPTAIERWWRCAAAFEEINKKLARAGVKQNDPMSPLISEMAVAPRRMGRWLVAWIASTTCLILIATALSSILEEDSPVQITHTSKGRLLVVSAPFGARLIDCPSGAVCIEIFSAAQHQ
jgi:hypothetical protein